MDILTIMADVARNMIQEGKNTFNVKVNNHEVTANVERTARQGLRRVTVPIGENDEPVVFVEQSKTTGSLWSKAALEGHKVMQVQANGSYIGVVVDGKPGLYREMGDQNKFLAEATRKQ